MRIVIVSDRESTGGAALAATRLATGLVRAGHEVFRIVSRGEDAERIGSPFPIPMRFRTGAVSRSAQAFFAPRTEHRFAKALERLRPDVINLHNLHNAVTAGWSEELLTISRRFAPVVWTLHDMWSFTGRCAYSGKCERYLTLCDASCPTPHEYPAWPATAIANEYRSRERALAAAPDAIAVSPSRWLAERARAGLWKSHRVEVIANGVDLGVFHPTDKPMDKPRTRRTILAVAHDFLDPRKGMHRIASLAAGFPEVTWLAMGKNAEKLQWGSATVRFLGEVGDDGQKAETYAAADALIHAASEDNLPNTIVEALACGTPVIALDRGGVSEIVRRGVSGWLIDDPAELALPDLAGLRASCRAFAEAELGLDKQVREYERIFLSC
ncbi:MAG TPA: glycosyltransferase [Thermoanaerobaculia bacterium]|jgi:glycosyltransferase involved in cell wall biosynthesis|nr:glycosyltransferase [Thermoanaerobaculia bacterium]